MHKHGVRRDKQKEGEAGSKALDAAESVATINGSGREERRGEGGRHRLLDCTRRSTQKLPNGGNNKKKSERDKHTKTTGKKKRKATASNQETEMVRIKERTGPDSHKYTDTNTITLTHTHRDTQKHILKHSIDHAQRWNRKMARWCDTHARKVNHPCSDAATLPELGSSRERESNRKRKRARRLCSGMPAAWACDHLQRREIGKQVVELLHQ